MAIINFINFDPHCLIFTINKFMKMGRLLNELDLLLKSKYIHSELKIFLPFDELLFMINFLRLVAQV